MVVMVQDPEEGRSPGAHYRQSCHHRPNDGLSFRSSRAGLPQLNEKIPLTGLVLPAGLGWQGFPILASSGLGGALRLPLLLSLSNS